MIKQTEVEGRYEQKIREIAYFLWENDGCPEGHAEEYWLKARTECDRQRRDAVSSTEPSTGQEDDNIDDLGRKLSDHNETLDQPIGSRDR